MLILIKYFKKIFIEGLILNVIVHLILIRTNRL